MLIFHPSINIFIYSIRGKGRQFNLFIYYFRCISYTSHTSIYTFFQQFIYIPFSIIIFLSYLLFSLKSIFIFLYIFSIRGKGSSKEGSKGRTSKNPDDDEELHVHVTADDENKVEKAAILISAFLNPIDDEKNDHKQKQLRELVS